MSDEAPPEEPLSEIARSKAQAYTDLEDIRALRNHPAWDRYFLRRLREKLDPIEDALLNKPLDASGLARAQAERAMLCQIANLLDSDEQGNRSITGAIVSNPPY